MRLPSRPCVLSRVGAEEREVGVGTEGGGDGFEEVEGVDGVVEVEGFDGGVGVAAGDVDDAGRDAGADEVDGGGVGVAAIEDGALVGMPACCAVRRRRSRMAGWAMAPAVLPWLTRVMTGP